MKIGFSALTAAAILAAGCAAVPEMYEPTPRPQAAPPPPTADALPAGAQLTVRTDQHIGLGTHTVGDRFAVVVTEPLVAANGQVVVPQGAVIAGEVTGIGSHGPDVAAVRVNFDVLQMHGQSYPFSADIVHARVPADPRRAERAIIGAVTGAAAGAALGAIIRGTELENVLVGGAIGAGAGTIIALGMHDDRARLPAGTVMTLQTTQQVALR
jgi:hypothetical protein